MTARTGSRVHPDYKTKRKTTNWAEYNEALRSRGDLAIWFSDEAIERWKAAPTGKRGAQRKYSDLAILTSLTLRLVFHLGLRQTQGFVRSLIRLMKLELDTPDFSTLSRRNRTVEVPKPAKVQNGPVHLIVDSSGLKILGDGEWHAHKHQTKNKRRQWRKLHFGVDADTVDGSAPRKGKLFWSGPKAPSKLGSNPRTVELKSVAIEEGGLLFFELLRGPMPMQQARRAAPSAPPQP